MDAALKAIVRSVLRRFNIGIMRYDGLQQLLEDRGAAADLAFLRGMPETQIVRLLPLLGQAKAQLRQDLFVLSQTDFKREGYFVEFGAADGVTLSNTFLLETGYGWRGILSEPARYWRDALYNNRSCHIETSCVWKESGARLQFNQTVTPELSTADQYSGLDAHKRARRGGEIYEVETLSLLDLLRKYDAPQTIDYLSIDTEGSEYDILSVFDFSEYSFEIITCEHNFSPQRSKIESLLRQNGYNRVFEELSAFDDWFIKAK